MANNNKANSVTITTSNVMSGTYSVGTGWTTVTPSVTNCNSICDNGCQIQGNVDIRGDLRVRGRNLTDLLDRVEQRLAILVPDPARLERYQALREAYEHYLTLEALLQENDLDSGVI